MVMIVSRTPLRISLAGGGSDVPAFYKEHGGAVVSMAINKYVYVIVNDKFDGKVRISYSITENVDCAKQVSHDIVRACMNELLVDKGIEITTVADIPGGGTGLGSSSSLAVGLLKALHRWRSDEQESGKKWSAHTIAETAWDIEANVCKHPGVGKQDQYAAAYGGVHLFEFLTSGYVSVQPIYEPLVDNYFNNHLLLLYTGTTRSASEILGIQENNLKNNEESKSCAKQLSNLARSLAEALNGRNVMYTGYALREGWELKKRLAHGITDSRLDAIHDSAIKAGAEGGKLLGAGGGGFFLFAVRPEKRKKVIEATGLQEVPFRVSERGSEVMTWPSR